MRSTIDWVNVDHFPAMKLRREFNNFATTHRDFYLEGLEQANEQLGFNEDSQILDVGASNGEFIFDAARAIHFPGRIIALDPLIESYEVYAPHRVKKAEAVGRLAFVGGQAGGPEKGFGLPFPDDQFDTTTSHNSALRAVSLSDFMDELWRVTRPGGLIVITTNEAGHAKHRHDFERAVYRTICALKKREPMPLNPPAHGAYADQVESMAWERWGVRPDSEEFHEDEAEITTARLRKYRRQIYSAFAGTDLPFEDSGLWRDVTKHYLNTRVVPVIARRGFFPDIIDRRMQIYRKPARAKVSLPEAA